MVAVQYTWFSMTDWALAMQAGEMVSRLGVCSDGECLRDKAMAPLMAAHEASFH